MLRPDARIISFEANADNLPDLAFVQRILGARYSYHHIGLSDRNGSAVLKVPVIGRTPVPGESSLLEEFDSDIEDRIGTITKVVKHEVNLGTFDSFRLRPAFVRKRVLGIADMQPAVNRLIDRLNEVQIAVAAEFPQVHHIDCRGKVGDGNWANELHPTSAGFGLLAELFDAKIRAVLDLA